MIPITEIYGRKASDGQINWITAIAMTAFHVGAVAAFFFIDWGAIATADRKSTRLNSSHVSESRMPSSA